MVAPNHEKPFDLDVFKIPHKHAGSQRLTELELNPFQLPNGQFPSAEIITKYLYEKRTAINAPQNLNVDNAIADIFANRQIACLEISSLTSKIEDFLFASMRYLGLTVEDFLPTARFTALTLTKLAIETLKVGIPFFPNKEELLKRFLDVADLAAGEKDRYEAWATFFANKPAMPKFLIDHYFNILTLAFIGNDTFMGKAEIANYLFSYEKEKQEVRFPIKTESSKQILADIRARKIIQELAQEMYKKPQKVGFIPDEKITFPKALQRKISIGSEADKKLNAPPQQLVRKNSGAECALKLAESCAQKYSSQKPPSPPRSPLSTVAGSTPVRKNSAPETAATKTVIAPPPPKPPSPPRSPMTPPTVPERSSAPPAPGRRLQTNGNERRMVLPSPHELKRSTLFNKHSAAKTMPPSFFQPPAANE